MESTKHAVESLDSERPQGRSRRVVSQAVEVGGDPSNKREELRPVKFFDDLLQTVTVPTILGEI